jgi:hypothetical protein
VIQGHDEFILVQALSWSNSDTFSLDVLCCGVSQ